MNDIHNYTLDELIEMGGKARNGKQTLFTPDQINAEFDRRREFYQALGARYASLYPHV